MQPTRVPPRAKGDRRCRQRVPYRTALPEGIRPFTPSNQVDDDTATLPWDCTVAELRRGKKSGRIVTTDPTDFGARRDRDLRRDERLYAYKRDGLPCRRCGTKIVTSELANRSMWWCPTCQPRRRKHRSR